MHTHDLSAWTHEHSFGPDNSAAERSTRVVLYVTLAMMVLEIVAGWWFNSMALLADGWHMSSHAVAIGLSAFAYATARRMAGMDSQGALAGYFAPPLTVAERAVADLLDNNKFYQEIPQLEAEMKQALSVPYAKAHCNGTGALLSAFFALDLPRAHLDELAMQWIARRQATFCCSAWRLGLRPSTPRSYRAATRSYTHIGGERFARRA